MRRTGCGTGHSRVTEVGRPCDAIGAPDRSSGRPGTSPRSSARHREIEEAGQVSLPGLVRRYSDQAAVWLKRSPKVQLVPWSA